MNTKWRYFDDDGLPRFYFEGIELSYRSVADKIATLESENAKLREQTRWIPVGERLPEERQDVLALDRTKTAYHWHYSKSLSNIFIGEYTHWMPLPEAPKEDVEQVSSALMDSHGAAFSELAKGAE